MWARLGLGSHGQKSTQLDRGGGEGRWLCGLTHQLQFGEGLTSITTSKRRGVESTRGSGYRSFGGVSL